MEYSKIIAVSGLPGLFELVASKSDGAIVRSLEDRSTRFVSSRVHNFSHLESIEVYTVRENVNLAEVLLAMQASSEALPDDKDGAALQRYFQKVYPDLDFTRVYSSDLKKMIKWSVQLGKHSVEIKVPTGEEEAPAGQTPPEPTAAREPAPKEKKAAKEPAKKEAKAPAKATEKAKAPAEEKTTKAKKETPKEKEPAKKESKASAKSTEKAKAPAAKKKSGK